MHPTGSSAVATAKISQSAMPILLARTTPIGTTVDCLYRHSMSISDSCISMQFFEDRGSKLYDLLPMCKFEQPYIQLSTSSINNILSHNKMLFQAQAAARRGRRQTQQERRGRMGGPRRPCQVRVTPTGWIHASSSSCSVESDVIWMAPGPDHT